MHNSVADTLLSLVLYLIMDAIGGVHFRVARAAIEYEGGRPELPQSVVIKQVNGSRSITTYEKLGLLLKPYFQSISLGATIEELAYRLQGYMIELEFYRTHAKEVKVPIPECFFSYYDYFNVRFIMIMEDLSECDNGEPDGFQTNQAKAMLSNLAQLHAQFWNASNTDKKLWSYGGYWLGNKEMSHHKSISSVFEATLKNFPIIKEQFPEVNNFAKQLSKDLDKLTVAVHVREPKTLIHGDYKISNIFIDMKQNPIVPYSIDWQWMGKGCAATDVAYFIYTSLSMQDPNSTSFDIDSPHATVDPSYPQYTAYEMSLLRTYHDALLSHGIKDYPFQLFEHQYSINQIYFTVFCLREKWSSMSSVNMEFFNQNRIDGLHLRNTDHMIQTIKRSAVLLNHIEWDRVNKKHHRARSWRNKL